MSRGIQRKILLGKAQPLVGSGVEVRTINPLLEVGVFARRTSSFYKRREAFIVMN